MGRWMAHTGDEACRFSQCVPVSAHDPASVCVAEGVLDGECWGLSLRQFTQLSPHEQVLLLVPEDCNASDVAAATAARVAKLVAAVVSPDDRQQLLVGLVREDAPRHLPWCVHIFERLRLQRQVRIFTLYATSPTVCKFLPSRSWVQARTFLSPVSSCSTAM